LAAWYDKYPGIPFGGHLYVDYIDTLLNDLRKEGIWVDEKVEEYEYGKFGWIMDPEGNKIELWELVGKTESPKK